MSQHPSMTAQVTRVSKTVAVYRTDDVTPVPATPRDRIADKWAGATPNDQALDGMRLSFLIHDVSRMRRSAFDRYMKHLGITCAQFWVLSYLSRHNGMMQSQLAEVMEVGRASIGDVIESLEANGLVMRCHDSADMRAKHVYLTRAAKSLVKQLTVTEAEFNSLAFADLSNDERATLGSSLRKVKDAVSRMD